MDNRRKDSRLSIPLNMEFMPLSGTAEYFPGETRNFSREGLSFESPVIDSDPMEPIMIKFRLLQKYIYIYALGEIIWKKQTPNKQLVGVKIRQINQESRSKKLGFPFNIWIKNMRANNN